ncbi:ABC transporter ATP-binding protein [Lacihabitans lacunae]|uniref:ABC transporter ATP-binding protein n=1 Tax=Lacihabitans lacunae TaxID=1028214 RepID=A0ABV7YQI4_9BACT
MIEIIDIQKRYGNQVALSIKKLEINKNELVGLVGNNGAGKTTLLSLILDLIAPTSGFVTSKSVKVSDTDAWKSYTGSFLNEGFLIPFLNPVEYLSFIGRLHGINETDVLGFLEENKLFFDINVFSEKYIRELSAGNKNKVGILASILSKPEFLILDEPFSNLDPSSQSWLKSKLKDLSKEGVTVIISSHDLKHVTEICSRILLLEEGRIVKDANTSNETLIELEKYFEI